MQVLKELLTKEGAEFEVKTTYEYVIDLKERLKETCSMAQEMLEKASGKHKFHYDKKSKPRSLDIGDKVLILLPTNNNKLLLQWKGPFTVVHRFNDCDYKIKVKDKVRTYHINLLKKYISRKEEKVCSIFELNLNVHSDSSCDKNLQGVSLNSVLDQDSLNASVQVDDGRSIVPLPSVTRKQFPKDVQVSEKLSSVQKLEVETLLDKYEYILTDVPKHTNIIECDLQLTTSEPIRSKPYPVPHALKETMRNEIRDMLSLGVIERSNSSYASPVVMIRKKDGSVRFCIDFRKLNKVIMFDPEPIPNPETLFGELHDSKYFSKIDLTKGYWQVPMSERSRAKTAFVTTEGQYQFRFMPFGLVLAGAVFTRMMRKLFSGVENVVSYIDDILIYTQTWFQHLIVLEKVLRSYNRPI